MNLNPDTATEAGRSSGLQAQRVWDLPTRWGHWTLVLLVAFSWWSAENHRLDLHRLSGYTVLGLLLFRLYWGWAGSTTARFAHFVRGPRAVMAYARSLRQRQPSLIVGHNPLGGWAVLALLGTLLLQTTSGLFAVDTDGLESGPLSHFVSFASGRAAAALHELSFNALLALIALHIAAMSFYARYKHEPLVGAMFSGWRALPPGATAALRFAGLGRAALGVLGAALLVWAVARGLRF